MEGFSIKCMRREYQGVLRLPRACAVIFLLVCIFYGAVALVDDQARDIAVLIVLTGLAICLGCVGVYFVISDKKWLLGHTCFGNALSSLGDAHALSSQIDEEERTAFYSGDHFSLLGHWLILALPRAARLDPYRICFQPVPKAAITNIRLEEEEPGEFKLKIACTAGKYEISVWETKDIAALRAWMDIREIERP